MVLSTLRDRQTIRCGDRVIAWAEFGDPTGRPVLVNHGGFETGDLVVEPEETARRGIRAICIDRPGLGASDRRAGRTIGDWAADAAAVADAVGAESFDLVGWSGGGPHSIAVASTLPHRVRSLALLASPGPVAEVPDGPQHLGEMMRPVPDLVAADAKGAAAIIQSVLETTMTDLIEFQPNEDDAASDLEVKTHPVWGPNIRLQIKNAFAQGTGGVADEAVAVFGPWDVDLAAVRCPVRIWHGTDDRVIGFAMGEWLATHLADSELTRCRGDGHLLFYKRWTEVLDWIVPGGPGP